MATHSSVLAWGILWTEEPGGLLSIGLHRVRTEATEHACMHWERTRQPTPVFLPGESQGQRSLVGCHLWGRTESDTTEATQQQQQQCWVFITAKVFLQLLRVGPILQLLLLFRVLGYFRLQGVWASEVVVHGLNSCRSQVLEHKLNSSGAHTQLLSGIWDLPGPGIKPVFPTAAGGFFTTEPPGKPHPTATFNGNESKAPYRSIIPCLKFIGPKMFQILQLFTV